MGITMMNEFEVRSYGWQELAVLYGPDSMPASADNGCPVGWGANPELKTELQVRMIVQYQGEP